MFLEEEGLLHEPFPHQVLTLMTALGDSNRRGDQK
jgi:hypothetical protein